MKDEVLNDPLLKTAVLDSIKQWKEVPEDSSETEEAFYDYSKYIYKKWIFIAACLITIILVTGYALTVGGYDIGFFETYEIIWNHLVGNVGDTIKDYVITQLRAPRIVLGIIAGAALAVCGVVMQSTLMNPLADPYTTGVSSGALFGASLATVLGISVIGGQASVVINAFVFSLIPMLVIIVVAKVKNTSPTVMIMAGIAVMYLVVVMVLTWLQGKLERRLRQSDRR